MVTSGIISFNLKHILVKMNEYFFLITPKKIPSEHYMIKNGQFTYLGKKVYYAGGKRI